MISRIRALTIVLLAFQQRPGVGTIEVSVRDAINRVPLQNVRIQLSYTGDASKITGLSAITDAAGRAVFVDLPFGNYGLTFERSGYRLSSAPQRLILQADSPLRQIEVALGQTSTMMGRILTSSGNPLADVEVSAVPIYYPGEFSLLAFPTLPAGQAERNERFMTPYYSQGTPVTIRSNAVAEVKLRVVPLQ